VNRGKDNQRKGRRGENLAAEYLAVKGLRILARNYRFEKGEIDLVCRDGRELVFVEVKTRSSMQFGNPEDAVSPAKQELLRNTAEGYCQEFHHEETFYRFDIVTVMIKEHTTTLHHIADAF